MKKGLDVIPVAMVDDVLKHALVRPLVPIEWDEDEAPVEPVSKAEDGKRGEVVTH